MTQSQKQASFRLGTWLLSRILSRRKNYGLFGDMEELYVYKISEKGSLKAGIWFWMQLLRTIPHYLMDSFYWSWAMFQNYFKITFRNIKRHKAYSVINFAGLAVGMACCILILTYVHWEISSDSYHENSACIYRLSVNGSINDRAFNIAPTNNPVGPYLAREFPEVEAAVRIRPRYRCAVTYQETSFFEDDIMWADASVFDIFTFPLVSGDPTSALLNPYTAVITESMAYKYFGEDDPTGKVLRFDDQADFTITAVMRDVPDNSHFTFDMLLSMETRMLTNRREMERWMGDFSNYTYLLLKPETSPKVLEERFPAIIDKNMGSILKTVGGEISYILQPLSSIYLYSKLEGEIAATSDIAYVYIFSCAALMILLLACINFMNLGTARSAARAREVGMRKVHGACKSKLVRQFLGESMIFSFVSLVLAIGLVEAVLPMFRSLSGRELRIPYFHIPWLIPAMLGLTILVGLIAGSYPAFYLARFQPAQVLKVGLGVGYTKSRFRQVLVTFQFAISTILIIGTTVIFSQLTFMKNTRLGFDKERMLVIEVTNDRLQEALDPIKQEMQMVPGVAGISMASHIPGWGGRRNVCQPEGFATEDSPLMAIIAVDADFVPTLGINLIAGRNFSVEFLSDPDSSVLINRTAAREFGWEDPIGKQIRELDSLATSKTVVGVVEDMHFVSLHNNIEPMLITNIQDEYAGLIIRLGPGNISAILTSLEAKWDSLVPGIPFEFYFLDESFSNLYQAEERLSRIFSYFSLLAIFIACLGLFGMAAYTAEQRTKEIGIRKVLGASTPRLILILNREFALLVLFANLFAWPLIYWFARRWLENFAYRMSLNPGIFILSALGIFCIGIVTVSFQSLKAAWADPIKSLKYE